MNSIAQQAVTKGYGNSENLRAQPMNSSFLVVMYSSAGLRVEDGTIGIVRSGPGMALLGDRLEQPRAVDVEHDQHQQHHEDRERGQHERGHRLRPERPDEQEHRLEVEQDEDDRDRVVLDRYRLDVEPVDRGGAAL